MIFSFNALNTLKVLSLDVKFLLTSFICILYCNKTLFPTHPNWIEIVEFSSHCISSTKCTPANEKTIETKQTAWWFPLFFKIQEFSNGVVLFLPIDGRCPKMINENYNCHCPSVKINMGMDLDVINPFSAMAGTILYFK